MENRTIIDEVVKKIEEMEFNKEACIADLISYNPETGMVDPMTQGLIYKAVKDECKYKKINFIENPDGFGGVAFFYKFKKGKVSLFSRLFKK